MATPPPLTPTLTPLPLTPWRRMTLLLGVPVALIAIGWTALTGVAWASRGSYLVHFSVPARGGQVTVSVGDGTVSVGPGTASRVTVSGTVHYSLIRPRVGLRSTASGVAVDTGCRVLAVSCSFDFAVAVPAGLGTDISVGAGDLTARGLTGPVMLSADSGDVTAAGLAGDVQIRNQSGDITASVLSGPDARIDDVSGDIKVTALSGQNVTVSNVSGDITLDFATVPRRVLVTGVSGDINLVLPPGGAAYRVITRSTSGSTTTGVPTNLDSPNVITATTVSGDITIVR
jgi:Putative adhesin